MTFSLHFLSGAEVGAMTDLAITPAVRGPYRTNNRCAHTYHRLTTDALGTYTLRLKNIVRGSRYRVEVASTGALIDALGEGTVAAGTGETTDVDLTMPYYVAGNTNNDLRIKVRKGSGVAKYLPFETQATSQAGVVIAYISQTADPIA